MHVPWCVVQTCVSCARSPTHALPAVDDNPFTGDARAWLRIADEMRQRFPIAAQSKGLVKLCKRSLCRMLDTFQALGTEYERLQYVVRSCARPACVVQPWWR